MLPYFKSVGRRYPETEDCMVGNDFLNDFTKIIQSKAYRRLNDKTQVIFSPSNSYVRTREVHTNEVIALSISISESLGLNTDLCMAIASGHDIGHTPYGHLGEVVLSELGGKEFKHSVFGVVVAQHIERVQNLISTGKEVPGLNLCFETLEGMLNHARGAGELSVNQNLPHEYAVVMFADKIAYTFSDLNDALRYGRLEKNEIPDCASALGSIQRERNNNVISSLVDESNEKGYVSFSKGNVFKDFEKLRKFMYENVYYKVDKKLHKHILERLYEFVSEASEFSGFDPVLVVSLLTDSDINYFGKLLLETKNPSVNQLKHKFGVFEILFPESEKDREFVKNKFKRIDYADPDLEWKERAVKTRSQRI